MPRLFLMLAVAPGRSPRFFSASVCISVMVLAFTYKEVEGFKRELEIEMTPTIGS